MARPLRIERAGAWYHVTARGIERRAIFADDRDRRHWLELLPEAVTLFNLMVHGYVLMANHYHLMMETREANLSRAMQWLQGSYGMWFNRRHGRVGPLFQGRFKAVVVAPNRWAVELSRYVHLNPVRTEKLGLGKPARAADRLGIRGRPDEKLVRERVAQLRRYRWSSYRAYVGLEKAPEWLTCARILELNGRAAGMERQRKYREYVEQALREGLAESPWEPVQGSLVLGGREFLAAVRGKLGGGGREQPQRRALTGRPSWKAVVGAIEAARGEKWGAFQDRHGDWGRDAALYLGRRRSGMRLAELGAAVGGADYAAVSAAIKRFERRLARDPKLRKTIAAVTEMLNVET